MNRILVIEDDDSLRENIIDLLTAEGYYPLQARDGEEGARLAWEWQPNLIICDILLPNLDGYGVLAKLSRDANTATIPFIFLTALSGQDQMRKGMGLGADDYLTKPFDLTDLLKAIEIRIGKNQTLTLKVQRLNTDRIVSLNDRLPRDLLAPLSQIMRNSQLLVEQGAILDGKKITDLARQIHQSSGRVIHLAQNYLFLADLEVILGDTSRVLEYQKTITSNAHDVIREITQAVAYQAGRQADLTLDLQEANLKIAYDHLLKILEEVLDIVFQYTCNGSPIKMEGSIVPNRGFYQLIFVNSGWELDDVIIQQVNESVLTMPGVTDQLRVGLGLFVVQRLVDLYRGEIRMMRKSGMVVQIVLALPLANEFRQKV